MSDFIAFSNKSFECINKDSCVKIVYCFRDIIFYNYFINDSNVDELLEEVRRLLTEEINKALKLKGKVVNVNELIDSFFNDLEEVIELIKLDVKHFYESDPACIDYNEVILAYPGLFAIMVYRISNILYKLNVPYIPRIMSEYAHSLTGIDIHPGATIGKNFFIDHGTGIVIGETTIIGNNVKMYQGVTLGAISLQDGQKLKGTRRHPKIEDNVTIYSNVSILGGDTVIGENSVIGCNAFITKSIGKNKIIKGFRCCNEQ